MGAQAPIMPKFTSRLGGDVSWGMGRGREGGRYILVRALPMPTQVTSLERISHE